MPQVWPRVLRSCHLSLAKSPPAPANTKLISRPLKFAARSAALISDFAVLMESALQPAAAAAPEKDRAIAVAMHMTLMRIA
jgi:hypothetical protein